MCRVGRSLPAGPAAPPQASAGGSRRAWATIASMIALSMVSTRQPYRGTGPIRTWPCSPGVSIPGGGKPPRMEQRTLGDVQVGAIGLGGMPMSIEGRPDSERSTATIHAALDAGVTLIDTADAYHVHADEVGHNETLIAQALASWSGDASGVLVATKGGHQRPGDGSWTVNGDPAYLKQAAEASLKRLGVDAIGLYQFHRPDPGVPYGDSVGALRDLLDEGKIRMAGISNANPAQIREASEILGGRLVSVQNQFSPAFRSSEPELDVCAEMD